MLQDVLAVLSGGVVGFSLGLVGGGGSILAVPLLIYVVGVPSPHVAIGTSALAVSLNAFANLIPHARAGTVRWSSAAIFAAAGAFGALTGSTIGKTVDGERLLFLFAILMVVVAVLMVRPRAVAPPVAQTLNGRIAVKLVAIGFAVGCLAGFFGIGGGFLVVPGLMLATAMPIINAIGSSLFSVGTFGLTTAANYARDGLIEWRLAGEFIVGGVAGGWLGMVVAMRLARTREWLNRVFAAIILLVAAYMLYRNFGAFAT